MVFSYQALSSRLMVPIQNFLLPAARHSRSTYRSAIIMLGALALFRIPFRLELRYRKQLQTAAGLADAMAGQERRMLVSVAGSSGVAWARAVQS
ncbi:hypothetical protein GCN74_18890 [Janthinobacterium sp. FT14W]|uniref:hypothetical protein n=1 Tax=Janthinobacterium sp. FT14W TaxID=2654253 RepID=UPI00126526D6|nr:hypothetical protein [Janthinobacterium sp. FT14W]KAB8057752.1 hypothetical protein GCN74_18890 [Janthinobacterium sp. FT14W]